MVGRYTYTSAGPTVSAISPSSGTSSGGTAVTVTGTGFAAGATVSLGGTAATNVTVVSSTSLTATTAAHVAGTVDVVVTNSDGQSGTLTGGYTYTTPAPTVSAISPSSGMSSGGTAVTVTGTGFAAGATVSLGGTAATNVTVVSSTSLTDPTAAHAAGAVDVVVTNSDGQSGTLTGGYTYTNPAPTVSAISPSSGTSSGGTAVTITGTGFAAGAAVSLGGTAATNVTVVSSTSLTEIGAAHVAGVVNVVVTNSDGQSGTLTGGYTYTHSAPTVSAISPSSGMSSGGTAVTVTGTGFAAGATVSLGGTAATNVTVVSSTSLTATTAAHAAGAMDVVVTNSDGQSGTLTGGYTYINSAPTADPISPSSGTSSGGTAASVTGTGFAAGATVSLGGTAATNVTVVSSTSLTATTAAHAAGVVNVVVTNSDGQSGTLTGGYTYTNPAPTVSAISPSSGTSSGATAVTFTGTGFARSEERRVGKEWGTRGTADSR